MSRFLRNTRGVALILTILIVSLIVALTLQFNRTMRTHVVSAGNIGHGLKALYAAKSGVAYGLALLKEDSPDVDTVQDDWANQDKLAAMSAGSQALFDGGRFELKIMDESGKIPINDLIHDQEVNQALKEVLRRFLELDEFGLEHEQINTIMDAITDWLDPDEDNTNPFHDSEEDYYMGLEKPYHCKNGPLDSPEELLLVKGISPELFYGTDEQPGIGPYISVVRDSEGSVVRDGEGKININTAAPMVLRSLHEDLASDTGKTMVDEMVDYRINADDEALKSSTWYHDAGVPKDIELSKKIIKTTSDHFQIKSVGHFGNMTKHIVAVAKRDPDRGDVQTLSWKIE